MQSVSLACLLTAGPAGARWPPQEASAGAPARIRLPLRLPVKRSGALLSSTTHQTRCLMRTSPMVALVVIAGTLAGALAAGCTDRAPTAASTASTHDRQGALPSAAEFSTQQLPPIAVELLTGRHEFTDDVDAQIRLKPEGRSRHVVNFDPSKMVVAKITVQPGARFPWHTHPGPVMVAVTQGDLVYTYGDDCVERTYPAGTAFVDPGNNVHYAFNPTGGETVLIATFLGVPADRSLDDPGRRRDGNCTRCEVRRGRSLFAHALRPASPGRYDTFLARKAVGESVAGRTAGETVMRRGGRFSQVRQDTHYADAALINQARAGVRFARS